MSMPRATGFVPAHDTAQRGFASDNHAGVHPEVLDAIVAANEGHQTSYGGDVYTARLQDVMRQHFGEQATTWPVFNGSGANVVSVMAMTDRWEAVICSAHAHLHHDEAGAPEKVGGVKLLPVATPDGKLTPDLVDQEAYGFGFEHRAQPKVVSVTQATEVGTCYTPDELRAVCERAHRHGLLVHLDGARLANAAAYLDVPLRALTTDVGVDVVSFGGTKNGLLLGEAVVVLNPDAVRGLSYLRKGALQLASKMRFLSVQLEVLLAGDLWLRSARHANTMARRLADGVRDLPGVTLTQRVESNAVFAQLPTAATAALQEDFAFYVWDEATGEVRWMTAFDTTPEDVDGFVAAIRAAVTGLV